MWFKRPAIKRQKSSLKTTQQASNTRAVGEHYETAAETFLHQRGLKTVERNFHCKMGEIDLVMRDQDVLVFVEVRFRKNKTHGLPQETVTATKQRKLTLTAEYYLQTHFSQSQLPPCRFDVVAIIQAEHAHSSEKPIEWLRDAFQLS